MIPERLSRLRREMEQRHIDVYVVPTADFHESEYVGAHFKARSYITGFTGSAGTAIITKTEAGLWTDARYFLQAKRQLENTGVTLYRMGEEGVPTIMEYLRSALPEGGTLGFDGRVINARLGAAFLALAEEKHGKLAVGEDLIGIIWDDRPELPHAPVRILTAEYSGRSTADKLADVRAEMKKQGATVHLLTSLYDIAWLLNVRGGDIDYVPVVLSYLALTEEKCLRFVQDAILTPELRAYLADNHITLPRRTYVHVTVYEEVGHGGASSVPAGVTEAISVDMGCVGEGLSCTERQVSICAKDSVGPYSYEVVGKLIDAAKKMGADYAVDVYPHYGSDVDVTLRAGFDIRHGLIGAGVYASHGYERSHIDGVYNTLKVICGYLDV